MKLLLGTFDVQDLAITKNGTDMCLTCVYQQSSNTGCIVLVISPVSSTILLDVTIERCLSPSVNGTYMLYGYYNRDNVKRSLKYAVVKDFVVDWIDLEYAITSSSPQADMRYFDSDIEPPTIDINLFTSTPMTSSQDQ